MSAFRALAFACVLLAPAIAFADIYQYTDQDGVVHIVNAVPRGVSAQLLVRGGNAPRSGAPFSGSGVAPSDHDPARFTRYDEWIRQACTLYQIPEQLVRAVIKVESDYDPRAVSVSGARGLMQLMPDTAERMQVRDIDNPRENIFGGVRLLRILANAFNGDLSLTIAAYNAGPDAVMRHGGIPPFEQTRNYVVKVTNFYRRYRTMPDVLEASTGY
ncbi:MAG TPA: transglycosylase SLT domain-containing protein [Polyangiaceae bacterium]